MKKLFLFVALFAWIGFNASAQVDKQDNNRMPPPPPDPVMSQQPMNQDSTKYDRMSEHWLYKDGKVVHMNNGTESPFNDEKEINGVWVRPNGDVVMKNNKIVKLKNNQYVDSQGRIRNLPKEK